MSREVYEGNYRVYWAAAIIAIAAPTVAEFAAATYVGSFVTKDGVALNIDEAAVDTASIETTFNTQIGGSWGIKPEIKMFRDGGTETAGYDLIVKGTNGFLIISEFGLPTVGKKCIVIPAEMGVGKPANSAGNDPQTFTVNFFATAEPAMHALVAA